MANAVNSDARTTLLTGAGQRSRSEAAQQPNQATLEELVKKMAAIEQQRAFNDATRARLTNRVTELEVVQEALIGQHQENLGRLDQANNQLSNLKKDTKKLKEQQNCMVVAMVAGGVGIAGGGAGLIAIEIIDIGATLVGTGGSMILASGSAAAKSP